MQSGVRHGLASREHVANYVTAWDAVRINRGEGGDGRDVGTTRTHDVRQLPGWSGEMEEEALIGCEKMYKPKSSTNSTEVITHQPG